MLKELSQLALIHNTCDITVIHQIASFVVGFHRKRMIVAVTIVNNIYFQLRQHSYAQQSWNQSID